MEIGTRLDELLDRWEEHRDQQQQQVVVEDLCRDCPELLDDLKKRIEALEFMDALYSTSKGPGGQDTATWQLGPTGGADSSRLPEMATTSHYQVERFHAKGGLGEVVLARDAVLHREVALKLIQRPHERVKQSRDRFLREAKITGLLEHPGIVPVYGEGTTADGRPFYTMRFIRGESLQEAIEQFHKADKRDHSLSERSLEFRKLLRHFIDVCNTVQYAHSRGVIHRDLKPANIMLGKYGETLVVDWGLAKSNGSMGSENESGDAANEPDLDNGFTPTQAGAALGTPAYMSPEQAAGQIDRMGPATDVYSLGATLYCVLTRHAPFEDRSNQGVAAILRRVGQGDFQPPRQVNPNLTRPLEAICLKAMALEPTSRYASPRGMADDIEHWLADEPISARPDSLRERAARWERHHRAVTRAAVAILLVATVVSSVAAVLVNQQRQVAENLADEKAQQARLSLATLQSVVFDIQSKLEDVPGAQTVRRSLLQTVIAGLEEVALSLDTAPRVDHALVWSHISLGDVFHVVGSIKGTSATESASKQFAFARQIAQKLVDENPENAEAQRDLFVSYERMGGVNLQLGNVLAAHENYEKSLKIAQQLAQADPQNALAQRDLSFSYNRLGGMNLQLGDVPAAHENYDASLKISQQLAQADPQNAGAQLDLSFSYEKMGYVDLQMGGVPAARENYEQGLKIVRQLAQADPQNAQAQLDLSVAYNGLGNVNLKLGDITAARENYEKSLKIAQQMAQADPQNAQVQRDLSVWYNRLGDVNLKLGDISAARENYEKSLKIVQQLAHADPQDTESQTNLGYGFGMLGDLEMSADDFTAAAKWFEQGIVVLEKLDKEGRITNQPLCQGWLKNQRTAVVFCKTALNAINDLQFALRQPKESMAKLLGIRSRVMARSGKFADAATSSDRLAVLEPVSGENLFLAAQGYALCGWGLKPENPQRKFSADEKSLREHYETRALDLLKQAWMIGYFREPAHCKALAEDPNLKSLRRRDDFKKLVAEIQSEPPKGR